MRKGNIDLQGALSSTEPQFNTNNLIFNGNFKYWYAGDSAAPDSWFLDQDGSSTVAKETTIVRTPLYPHCAKMVRSGGTYAHLNLLVYPWRALNNVGKDFTASVWIKCSVIGGFRLAMHDANGQVQADNETTDWELLTVTLTQDNNDIGYGVSLQTLANGTTYISEVMCVEGSFPMQFNPNIQDHLYGQTEMAFSSLSVITTTDDDYSGLVSFTSNYAYPKAAGQFKTMSILCAGLPSNVFGHPVVIDSAFLTYGTNENDDYIDSVSIRDRETGTIVLNYTTDLGSGSSGVATQELISTPVALSSGYALYLHIVTGNATDVNTDIRFYSIRFKYHVKVHG